MPFKLVSREGARGDWIEDYIPSFDLAGEDGFSEGKAGDADSTDEIAIWAVFMNEDLAAELIRKRGCKSKEGIACPKQLIASLHNWLGGKSSLENTHMS